MNLIAAVDENWAIGKNNQLLVRIPADQKFFREMTTGRVVVMGRKTLESFPNGQPLKNRTNIVLTHNKDYAVKDAVVVHSMDELHEELKKYDSDDVFVIGGEKIYEQLLDECDVAHITKIDFDFDTAAQCAKQIANLYPDNPMLILLDGMTIEVIRNKLDNSVNFSYNKKKENKQKRF